MATSISFDGNNLQTANVTTSDIDHESIANKNANTYALAHANKSVLPFINYPSRIVTIKGNIKGSSISDLDTRIDAFKAYFNKKDGNLDIGYIGGTRRYIATVTGLLIDRPQGLTTCDYTVVFTCTNPFGMNTASNTPINSTGNTSGSTNFAPTFLGNAPYQLPVITVTLTAVTGATGGYMVVTNHATGQGITLLGLTFTAADVFVFDSSTRTVTQNGVEVDYIGSFIELGAGAQQIDYTDGFTTRTFTINISQNALFL